MGPLIRDSVINRIDRIIILFKKWPKMKAWLDQLEKRYTRHTVRLLALSAIIATSWAAISILASVYQYIKNKNQYALTRRGDLHSKLLQTGRVESFTTVAIKSKQSGIITDLYAQEGQEVKEGQPLVAIRQLSALAGNLAQMRADIEKQERETSRVVQSAQEQEELFNKGFVSRLEFQAAQDKARAAQIDLTVMRRKLKLTLDEIGLSNKTQGDQIVIRSPLSGIVMRQLKQVGELVNEASSFTQDDLRDAIYTVSDIRKMIVTSQINEVDIWKVKKDQVVDIRLDAIPGTVYQGKVLSVSPSGELERDTPVVTFKTRVEILRPDYQLKPMMTADLDIHTGDAQNAVVIPLEAVHFEQDQPYVWVERNFFLPLKKVKVKLGLQTSIEAEVLEGLAENERIVKKELKIKAKEPE